MITALSIFARAGVVALGVLTGFSGSVMSAPLGPIMQPQAPAAGAALPIQPVVEGEFRGGTNPTWRRNRGGGEWRGNRQWRGGDRHWRGDRGWREGRREWRRDRGWREGRRDWRRDRWDRRWNRRNYYRDRYSSGIYLGFGAPYYGGGYYDPGYYAPPRRYYRAPVAGNAHVRWCYNRYRSYRAWDNTFQPYNGPRQQCFSPYS